MIELNNLTFQYAGAQNVQAGLKGINLAIREGEMVLLTGESGCGKTTLTRVLNGLCPRFYDGSLDGKYLLQGQDTATLTLDEIGIRVGNVFQDPRSQFFTTNTTDEIVLAMENRNYSRPLMETRLREMSRLIGVENLLNRNIFELSSGEKQKIAIAAACAMHPRVLVLDEPSANLDLEGIKQLTFLLKRLKEQGFTIVVSEHRIFYLYGLLDRMLVMKDGAIKQIYSRKEVQELSVLQLTKMGLRLFRLPKESNRDCKHNGVPLLEIKNLNFSRGKIKILEALSFDLYTGQISVVTGPNGTGKTTLCKLIIGLLKEGEGSVLFSGRRMKKKERISNSFFVGQDVDYQLFTSRVFEEVMLNIKKTPDLVEKTNEILQELNLLSYQDRHPASLSGGQKQRVLIASAMVRKRPILVLDEPTSGLDGRHMRILAELLKSAAGQGACVLIITHDREFIELTADRVFCLENGKLDEKGRTLTD